jgi:hypothetical protein
MSNFHTQRIVNQYPLWTKARQDPSSVAQRMFSAYADYFDFAEAELVRIKDERFLLKWHMGHEKLYSIYLEEDDYMTTTFTAGGGSVITYPSLVVGVDSVEGDITLSRDTSFEYFIYGIPTRFSLIETQAIGDLTIWDSSVPNTFGDMSIPERLVISVSNSTVYNKPTTTRDRLHSGYNQIVLEGKDINGLDTKEYITIPDDGIYITHDIWTELSVKPLIDGFNGSVTIGYKQPNLDYVLDPYRTAVLEDIEGPLKLRLEVGASHTNLEYFTSRYKLGNLYRNGSVDIDNEERVGFQRLRASDGSNYVAVDFAISHENTMLYVLDESDNIHVYDHGLNAFSVPAEDNATLATRVVLNPLRHYAKLDNTESIWTFYRRLRGVVDKIIIKRIAPDATIEYLQAGLTWSGSVYEFPGIEGARTAASSWDDFRFTTEYDQVGQWDYYITTYTHDGEVTTYHTAVMVDYLDAEVSIDTEISDLDGIFFSEDGNIIVYDATNFYRLKEHRDTYFANIEEQQLIVRENYSSVEVTA